MQDFSFFSPTRLIVGRNTHLESGKWIKEYGGTKVLVHHDSAYVKQCGLLGTVIESIRNEGIEVIEIGGVVPNPRLELVHKCIEICRAEGIDFILAIGGGSVIDSCKAIAMGIPYGGDVWDFFSEENSIIKAVPTARVPVGVVLTIAATGSEASNSCVITKEDENLKRFCDNDINRPLFAIENPELTMSLPPFQTACGIIDIMSHSFERYFTPEKTNNELTDRLCEAIFHTCIDCGKVLMKEPNDYDARANIMVASSLSHNGLTGIGRTGDWASHFIEHELSGDYDVTHGAGLAVIIPAWMKYVYQENIDLFVKWATRVMGVAPDGSKDEIVLEGIVQLERFFEDTLNISTRMSKLSNVPPLTPDDMLRMAKRVRKVHEDGTIGWLKRLNTDDIVNIFKLAQ